MLDERTVKKRFAEIARSWRGYRETGRSHSDYEVVQCHHWFFCLGEVLEFRRMQGEDLDAWIARAGKLSAFDE